MSSWRWSRTGRRSDAADERRARRRGAGLDARFGAFFVVRAGGISGACSSFDARALASSPQQAPCDLPCSRVTSPIVRAQGLVKTFGQGRAARRVLDGAALEVAGGELVAVVGRSGSGKSTLLHLLGGLDKPEAGTIELAGERVDGRSERDLARLRARRVGFVFQFFHLVPELSGEENVALAARLPDSAPGAPERGRELIERLGLGDAAGRMPHELSGGEQQRIALARALVNDPAVVLADEPTGNLDPEAAAIVLDVLREVAAGGRAVVLVTHEEAATDAATRVLRLQDGVLAA
jgi:ABC-type lipoprotein export system ATPase subunit